MFSTFYHDVKPGFQYAGYMESLDKERNVILEGIVLVTYENGFKNMLNISNSIVTFSSVHSESGNTRTIILTPENLFEFIIENIYHTPMYKANFEDNTLEFENTFVSPDGILINGTFRNLFTVMIELSKVMNTMVKDLKPVKKGRN